MMHWSRVVCAVLAAVAMAKVAADEKVTPTATLGVSELVRFTPGR